MPSALFVPLRVFTAFTMLEGAIDPKALAKHAKTLGFPATAICDRNGLYAAMAYSGAAKADGVQPILPLFPVGNWGCPASIMAASRAFHSATMLPNGEVLLLGGVDAV